MGLSKRRIELMISIALGTATMLLLAATRALEQSIDSLAYAESAKLSLAMYHPHHLLFVPVVRAVHLVLEQLGVPNTTIVAGQMHNIVWAAIAVIATFLVLARRVQTTLLAVAGALCMMAAQGLIFYSTQVEVYVPVLGCTALLVLLMERSNGLHSFPAQLLAAALLALSVLYHQTNVLFVVAMAFYLLRHRPAIGPLRVAGVMAGAGVITLVVYAIVYVNTVDPGVTALRAKSGLFEGLITFSLRYAVNSQPDWGTFGNLLQLGALGASQLWNVVFVPDAIATITGWLAFVAIVVLVGWNIRAARRSAGDSTWTTFSVVWLLSYYVFFLWWYPSNPEFFLVTLLPLLLLVFATLDRALASPRSATVAGVVASGLAVAVVLPINVWQTALPAHRSYGPAYAYAEAFNAIAGTECVVLAPPGVIHNLRYYFERPRRTAYSSLFAHLVFYQQRRTQLLDDRVPGQCMLVPVAEAEPRMWRGRRNAYTNPAEWWRFMQWLFQIEMREGGPIEFDAITVVTDSSGKSYFHQSGEARTQVAELTDFFAMLDRLAGPDETMYRDWLADNRGTVMHR